MSAGEPSVWTTCLRKRRYSESRALIALKAMKEKFPDTTKDLTAYPCALCHRYHLGSLEKHRTKLQYQGA